MKKGDMVYYARIIPSCDIYEVCDLKIRTVMEDWFCGSDVHTKQARLFENKCLNETVFYNRNDALEYVKKAEKHRVKRQYTVQYEED